MDVNLGRFVLGVYTAFLAVGGLIGSASAGSHKSLVAGIGSAFLCLVLLLVSIWSPRGAFVPAVILAVFLAGFFIYRMRKSGKFMPAGMLAGLSIVFAALFVLAASNADAPSRAPRPDVTADANP
jgi:uncharacterized membrane protein (UPF0136 family)